MTTTGAYADVNGLHLYYEVHGSGQPLLLLHGGTCLIGVPPMGLDAFASMFQVIAPEQMGHGHTADDAGRAFHYHDLAETTVELLDHLKIDSTSVVGLSDGGIVGLDLAIHHPERVTRLAVSGTNFRADGCTPEGLQWLLSTTPDDWPRELREAYERVSPDGPRHWPLVLQRLQHMWAVEPDYTAEQLAGITAPTLIIAGDHDLVTPEHTLALFRAIPNAQLCVLPDTGHGTMPVDTVITFLTRPASSSQ